MAKVNYLEILDQAWQQHLALRESSAPTVISLFAGCGGSSLGYSMAGYRELLAVEWNDNAIATFELNFPDVPIYHGDIHKLSVEECLELTGLKPGELDLLDGSPPCQGFSTAGKRKMTDKRNQLYMEFVRLLRELQPKVFVMENVSGLVKGKMKLIFADIMKELKASGYKVRCKLLNAMYFNVPQSRQRLIWIGVREDVEREVSYPQIEKRVLNVQKALVSCDKMSDHRLLSERVKKALLVSAPGYYPGGGKHGMGRALKRTSGRMSSGLSLSWLSWIKPSFTLVKEEIADSGMIHPDGERYVHPVEMKRIAAFPDLFEFIGKRKERIERIGNSVPPLFMRAIANHIRSTILIDGE